MTIREWRSVAVVGAGIAGAAAVHALALAGHLVPAFGKARAPGGLWPQVGAVLAINEASSS